MRYRLGVDRPYLIYAQTGDEPSPDDEHVGGFPGPADGVATARRVVDFLNAPHLHARELVGPPHAHQDGPCGEDCYRPRTWRKLVEPDGLASVLNVEGHGRFVIAVRRELGNTTYVHEDDVDEHGVQRGITWTLGRLRELGNVTEVRVARDAP
jgi:hypothetical protein